ncbi:MAG: tetratricopeptide repeat protein [Streptosporangiaceae bacterium]|nr:tetratricopeptide repeat protein [Streptosporangiaceae bacterium]
MAGDDSRAQVQLAEDTLARRRRVLGEDHPDTLASADNLAISLRAVGGHPGTLTSVSKIASCLLHRDEHQAARELAEDTLACRRRVLGEDHPDTLASAFQLVGELTELGEYQAAKELNEDTLDRRRRVLGDRHPDTMTSAALALFLSGLAADPKARALLETMLATWSQPGEGREPDG